ncbi:MAG: tetratricopeptide repeat protein [Acidobacteriota bacterium]
MAAKSRSSSKRSSKAQQKANSEHANSQASASGTQKADAPKASTTRASKAEREPAPRWAAWAAAVVLALLVAVAFGDATSYPFVNFDDDEYVTENPPVLDGLTTESLEWAWSTFHAANWHPLTWMSHMLDVELYGEDAGGHHLSSLLLHLGATLLLFFALRQLSGSLLASFLIAGVFAVHPTRVESVVWISERKDVLAALLWMATTLAYVQWTRRGGAGRYVLVAVLFALGLTAKPLLVTLPFTLLLLDHWPLRRSTDNPFGIGSEAASSPADPASGDHARKSLFGLVMEKAPLFALSAASSAVTVVAQSSGGAVESIERLGFGDRLVGSVVGYARYLEKAFWPQDLSLYYPRLGVPETPAFLLSAVLLLGITGIAWRLRRRRPYLLLGWLWFIGTLVPMVGLVQVGGQAIADRYSYVPYIGLAFMLAFTLVDWVRSAAAPGAQRQRWRIAAAACLALLVGLSLLARQQTAYWQDSIDIFERSIEVTEGNYLLLNNLGATYTDRGQPAQGIRALERSLAIHPDYAQAHNNLGLALERLGRFQQATERYRKAVEIQPRYGQALNNLGNMLIQGGRPELAIQRLERAVELEPNLADRHNNLGIAQAMLGRLDDAFGSYRRALDLDPDYAEAWSNLGVAQAESGQLEEAQGSLSRSLEIDPINPGALTTLGTLYADLGRIDLAVDPLERAVALEPRMPQARYFLTLAYVSQGQFPQAQEQMQALREINPELAQQLALQVRQELDPGSGPRPVPRQ